MLGGTPASPDLFQVGHAFFANPLSFYFDHGGYPLVDAGAGSWIINQSINTFKTRRLITNHASARGVKVVDKKRVQ